jgi:hypothetical protein
MWGQDPTLVNHLMPRYTAWKSARLKAQWARQQLPLHQPVPALAVQGIADAQVPRLGESSIVLLFMGQCES